MGFVIDKKYLRLNIYKRLNIYFFLAERDQNGHRWILKIRNFNLRQSGQYEAMIKNQAGFAKKIWNLHLKQESPKFEIPAKTSDEKEVRIFKF